MNRESWRRTNDHIGTRHAPAYPTPIPRRLTYLVCSNQSMPTEDTHSLYEGTFVNVVAMPDRSGVLRFAAQLFGCFVLLDAGPYRLERGGQEVGLYCRWVDGRRQIEESEGAARTGPIIRGILSFRERSLAPK